MLRLLNRLLGDLSHDHVLWRLELKWKYGPLWARLREFAAQSIVDMADYIEDRGNRLCDWMVPPRYRR